MEALGKISSLMAEEQALKRRGPRRDNVSDLPVARALFGTLNLPCSQLPPMESPPPSPVKDGRLSATFPGPEKTPTRPAAKFRATNSPLYGRGSFHTQQGATADKRAHMTHLCYLWRVDRRTIQDADSVAVSQPQPTLSRGQPGNAQRTWAYLTRRVHSNPSPRGLCVGNAPAPRPCSHAYRSNAPCVTRRPQALRAHPTHEAVAAEATTRHRWTPAQEAPGRILRVAASIHWPTSPVAADPGASSRAGARVEQPTRVVSPPADSRAATCDRQGVRVLASRHLFAHRWLSPGFGYCVN